MAHDTPLGFRSLVLYEIYVRNHGPHGTFADVEVDLERIRSMGVDVIWLMPIHPIGKLKKKGSLGCPYSIADYREVNPEYGTKADLKRLIERAHGLGLKVMIDVVYNHTAHDSQLLREHPEWFHQGERGEPTTTVPDWSDVIDLKHPDAALSMYLIETLQQWAALGIDGFRCDVASLVPLEFWLQARRTVAETRPGVIWLAESVHAAFVAFRRGRALRGLSDGELYAAFDLTYAYDIWPAFQAAVAGRVPAARYLEMVRFQDSIYPVNFIKLRCVENHDQTRIMALAPTCSQGMAWTAFEAFNKGAFLIYAGQESAARHTPSLFDVDRVEWGTFELQSFLSTLAHLKKDPAAVTGRFVILDCDPAVQATWYLPGASLYGVFNTGGATGKVHVQLPDGEYANLLSGALVRVQGGDMNLPETAVILRSPQVTDPRPFYSDLLDYDRRPN